jgi:hypothetical protein
MKKLLGLFLLALAFFAPDQAQAANRFAVCTTTCTWDSTSTAMWCATDTGCTGATAPGSGDAVIFNTNTCVGGTTCTVTVDATINGATFQSITAGTCTASTTGCILDFSVNNPSITLSGTGMNLSGSGTRKYLLGSGTFTFTTTTAGALFDIGTVTNLDGASTFTAPIVYNATTAGERQFNGGGRTFGSFTVNANTSRGGVRIFSANTFSSISIDDGSSYIMFPASATNTITGSGGLILTGTSSNQMLVLPNTPNSGTATISLSSGTSTPTWAAFMGITTTGAGTMTATDSFNLGRNTLDSGDTITIPSGGGGGRIIGG